MINLVYGMLAFDNNKDKEICLGKKKVEKRPSWKRAENAGDLK